MKNFKFLSATFEQSLNLEDDSLIKYMIQDVEKPGVKEKPVLLRCLAISLVIVLYLLTLFAASSTKRSYVDSPIPKPEINFLPVSVFFVLLLLFLLVWIWTLSDRNNSTNFFWTYINTTNFLRWLVIEFNLLFLTMFLKPLTLIGVSILFIVVFATGYVIVRSKKKALEVLLFNRKSKLNSIDNITQKIIQFILKYGWIVVIVVVLCKFIFPNTMDGRTDIVGVMAVIAMWVVFDIGYIVAEVYLFLPYLLYGYYKNKYPEEYREWEGKTQIEWYGEKYFNKHIKGTEKEEKTNS